MPTVPCMGTTTVPCLGTSTVPCLGTFASALPGHVCSPCLGRLPVPCLGTLASVHALPGHACSPCLGRLPVPCLGTLASSLPGNVCQCLPGHVVQSLPGTLCQFPAWERLPMPCLGMFASSCLGMLFAWTPSLCTFLMLICTSSSLICHAPLQNNDSKKTIQLSVPRILQNNVGAMPLQCASQPQLLRKNTKGVVCVRGEKKQKAMCQQ